MSLPRLLFFALSVAFLIGAPPIQAENSPFSVELDPTATGAESPEGFGVLSGAVVSREGDLAVEGAVVGAEREDGRKAFARTDATGAFSLELEPGNYTVTISHPQFERRSLSGVVVVGGQIVAGDVVIAPIPIGAAPAAESSTRSASADIEQIVVTGRYVERAIDQTRFSDSVLDILSSQDFKVTADSDVVGALTRVSGVTVVDGNVFIRGLGERYQSTLFNNALLPSPDPTRRVVRLDLFPTGVMEQLTIQKTWTPSLPADFSGGSIQLKTRSIPEQRESKFSAALSYREGTTGTKQLWNKGGKWDWAGIDTGFRDLPSIIEKATKASPTGSYFPSFNAEQRQAEFLSLNRDYDTSEDVIPPDYELNYSYGDTYDSRIGDFGWLVGLRHRNQWLSTEELRQNVLFFENTGQFVGDRAIQTETTNSIDYQSLITGTWKFRETQELEGTFFYTRTTDKTYLEERGFEFENDIKYESTAWEWREEELWSLQLAGDHFFPELLQLDGKWGVTYSQARRDIPDYREYVYVDEDCDFDRGDPLPIPCDDFELDDSGGSNRRVWENLEDTALDAHLDLDIPFAIHENLFTSVKFGTRYYEKDRSSRTRTFRYNTLFLDEEVRSQPVGDVFADENIGDVRDDKAPLQELPNPSGNYDASETLTAGYLQTDSEIFGDWRMMAGFRYEISDILSETPDLRTGNAIFSDELNENFLLPGVTLTWQFRDDMQLRAAYSQTVNRPDLREFARAVFTDPETRETVVGNPNLTSAKLANYDLRWEWYHSGLDSLSLALFYKDIDSPIERNRIAAGSNNVITFQNAKSAYITGLEFSARQSLEFMGDWARDLSVRFNGALMKSEVDASGFNATNPKRRLQGQSDWVVNYIMTYDNLIRDFRATLAFNMFGDRITEAGAAGLDDQIELPVPRLDVILQKGFSVYGRPVSIRFRARNLLDPDITRERAGFTEREFSVGRNFQLKVQTDF